ncbi:MAG: hypothetical protein AMXMBFR57_22050 [Acidimicrobiia bacterium]|jgi:plastocyanin
MRAAALRLFLVAVVTSACGGSSGSTPTTPGGGTTTPTVTNTITITAQGANPLNIQISQGTRVLFINNDSRAHNMASDPHPAHTDCPELNVGLLQPGQQRESGNMNTVRTCRLHDHDNPTVTSLQGSVTIR